MIKRDTFEPIQGEGNLVALLNHSFKDLMSFRIVSTPNFFNPTIDISLTGVMYYRLLVFETYAHQLVERLHALKADIEKYNTEFNGSWRYYALADRQENINKYGYDEEDYNADGTLKTKLQDSDLEGNSLIYEYTSWNDIVFNLKARDFTDIYLYLRNTIQMCITKVKGFENLASYRNEDGKMVERTFADKALDNAGKQHHSDLITDVLYSVLYAVESFITDFEKLKYNKNNKAFFSKAIQRIDAILAVEVVIQQEGGCVL